MLSSEDRAEIQAAAESAVECAWCDGPAVGYASVEPGFAEGHPSCGVHGSGFHGAVEFQFIRPEQALALLAELTRIEQALEREGLAALLLTFLEPPKHGGSWTYNPEAAADAIRTHLLGDNEGKTTL